MKYYRGNGGFTKRFAIVQNGTPVDLINEISGTATVRWWFKRPDGTTRFIDWQGEGTIEGANNEIALFDVPGAFFNEVIKYESQLEVYNDGILVFHSKQKFLVEVDEPAGVHTDV